MDTNHNGTGRLFVLDASAGRILSMKTDGFTSWTNLVKHRVSSGS